MASYVKHICVEIWTIKSLEHSMKNHSFLLWILHFPVMYWVHICLLRPYKGLDTRYQLLRLPTTRLTAPETFNSVDFFFYSNEITSLERSYIFKHLWQISPFTLGRCPLVRSFETNAGWFSHLAVGSSREEKTQDDVFGIESGAPTLITGTLLMLLAQWQHIPCEGQRSQSSGAP